MGAATNDGGEPKSVLTLKDLLDLNITETPWLWDGILPQQVVGFLTGPSDSGKSTLVRQLAIEVAKRSETFLGRKLNTRTGQALIVCTEDDANSIAPIARKQAGNSLEDAILSRLYFAFRGPSNIDQLDQFITKIGGVDLIVLDVWTDTFTGDLNQTVPVRLNLKGYKRLVSKHECMILCLHHVRKGSDDQGPHKGQMLGSQGIEAVARVVLDFRKEGGLNYRRLSITKSNYIADSKKTPMILKLDEESMLLEMSDLVPKDWGLQREYGAEKEFFMAHILKLRSDGLSFDKIIVELGNMFPEKQIPSKGTIYKWWKETGGEDSQSVKL